MLYFLLSLPLSTTKDLRSLAIHNCILLDDALQLIIAASHRIVSSLCSYGFFFLFLLHLVLLLAIRTIWPSGVLCYIY